MICRFAPVSNFFLNFAASFKGTKLGFFSMKNEQLTDVALLLLRIAFGGAMILGHGWSKLLRLFSGDPIQFADPFGLGPTASLALAAFAEFLCSLLVISGLFTRWALIPLMFTMLVAIFAVHWQNGWQAIADTKFCLFNCYDANEAAERLAKAKDILQEHGNYEWLTEQGGFVILNNGIEFGATYLIMLLALFYIVAGKYVSTDYWLCKKLCN